MAEEQKNKTEHTLKKKGFLKGHGGWVTSLAVGEEEIDGEKVEFLLSGSRDKTLIKWRLDEDKNDEEDREWGRPAKMFTGHSHFVNEICLTIDGRFCFSASWDGTVRLWNTTTGKTVSKLIGHTRESDGENISGVTNELGDGFTSGGVPESDGTIPRGGEAESSVNGEADFVNEVRVTSEHFGGSTPFSVFFVVLVFIESPLDESLITRSGEEEFDLFSINFFFSNSEGGNPSTVTLEEALLLESVFSLVLLFFCH